METSWFRRLLRKEESAPALLRPQTTADDHNAFTFALYEQLRGNAGNLFFSPYGIRTTAAMACAGARGETATQMKGALRISYVEETQERAFAPTGDELTVANSLWGQAGEPPLADFVELIARRFDGTLNQVDFRGDAETARATINRWVEGRTRQRIRQLIPSRSLSADTRLVLVNAVYFKGMWAVPFLARATRPEPFYLEDGGTIEAPLMHQQEECWYTQGAGYQAVELPYRGGAISMLIWLPDRKDGLPSLERMPLERVLLECEANMFSREVKLSLPRFKIHWGTIDIAGSLRELGMPLAFTPEADFSGMNGQQPSHPSSFFIANFFQQAIIDVNEEGTEAAAATAILGMFTGTSTPLPIATFRADHPFLFAIRDRRTGRILFLGRVANPTAD